MEAGLSARATATGALRAATLAGLPTRAPLGDRDHALTPAGKASIAASYKKAMVMAEKELGQSIMKGEFTNDSNLDEFTNTFLNFVSRRKKLPRIDNNVGKEDLPKRILGTAGTICCPAI